MLVVRIGDDEKTIPFAARYHVCEDVGNYIMEIIMDEFVCDSPQSRSAFVIPFIDAGGA